MTGNYTRSSVLIACLITITFLGGFMADAIGDPAATPATPNEGLDGKSDGYRGRSIIDEEIGPTAVPDHPVVGSPMHAVLEEWLVDAELLSRYEGTCIISEYRTPGGWLTHEVCPDNDYGAGIIRFGDSEPTHRDSFGRTWMAGDFEGDGLADVFYDFVAEVTVHDDNEDGNVDR